MQGVQLSFCLFQRHSQGIDLSRMSIKPDNTVLDGNMTYIGGRDDEILVGLMGNQESFPVMDRVRHQ